MNGVRAEINLSHGGDAFSNALDLGGITFKLKLNRSSFLYISASCPGRKGELFGVLSLTLVNEASGETVRSRVKTTFGLSDKGEMWRPVTIPGGAKAVQKCVNNNRLVLYVEFTEEKKTATGVIAPVKGVRQFSTLSQESYQAFRHKSPREQFGYIGLRNLSANCYLNSVLQLLFTIPAFRRLIYFVQAPTDIQPTVNVLLNLQILFYQMETFDKTANASALITSFGWTQEERHMQNDATEMWTVLLSNLNAKIKPQSTRLEDMFMFTVRTHTEHRESGYHQTRDEVVSMLNLALSGFHSIQDGVNSYGAPEHVPDYQIDGWGKVVITIRHEIVSGPEFLVVQLNRYVLDPQTFQSLKNRQNVDFPEVLHVQTVGGTAHYRLHGICVHLGDTGGGHYFAYIRPSMDEQWIQFNDDRLSAATMSEIKTNALSNGYLFMYARQDAEPNNYAPVERSDIPESIITAANNTELSTMEVVLVPEVCLLTNTKKGCTSYREYEHELSLDVGDRETGQSVYQRVGALCQFKPNSFRLWKCSYNGKPVQLIKNTSVPVLPFLGHDKIIFIEESEYSADIDNHTLIFIKKFNGTEVTLERSMLAERGSRPISDIFEGSTLIPPGKSGDYWFFCEEDSNKAVEIMPNMEMSKLTNGTCLVYQSKQDLFRMQTNDGFNYYNFNQELATGRYSFFLDYTHRLVRATLRTFQEDLADIAFPCTLTIRELKEFVTQEMGIEWQPCASSLVIYYTYGGSYQLAPLSNNGQQPMSPSERYSIVFQTVDGVDEVRMESLRPVLVQVSHDGVNIDSWHCVPVLPEAPVRDVLNQIDELKGQRLRVAVQAYGRLDPPLPDYETPINKIPPYLRVDILGDGSDQKRCVPVSIAAPNDQISCCFFLDLIPDESFLDTKKRIAQVSKPFIEITPDMRFHVQYRQQNAFTSDSARLYSDADQLVRIEVYKQRESRHTGSIVIRN